MHTILLKQYEGKGSNGYVLSLLSDFSCFLGIYESTGLWYRYKRECSYQEGFKYFFDWIYDVYQTTEFNDEWYNREQMFEYYLRWVTIDHQRIEIEEVASDPWLFVVMKGISDDNYYLTIFLNRGPATGSMNYKVKDSEVSELKDALDTGDNTQIKKVIEKYYDF